jgi:NTE family protein
MEEHRIPIDYIAGTSMGGLIGGMYAIDMTPQELRELTTSIDWIDLLRPVPGYDTLSFRRKEDRRAFPNSLEIGLKGGLKFPPGLNSGHSIGLLLNRLTLPYSTVNDFDDLPIPFRCLATDMVEARQIVLEDGSLATALQATMAIPGVFTPIEIDGSVLLSDGGLLNNVPTDVAEQQTLLVVEEVLRDESRQGGRSLEGDGVGGRRAPRGFEECAGRGRRR